MAEQVKTYFGKTDQDEISCTHCGTEFASKPAFIYHLAGCLPTELVSDSKHKVGLAL